MENAERPVIVFDSGLGGISVLKQLIDVMPNEAFVYYGDSANAPYGPRDPGEVCGLTLDAISGLDGLNAKAIVIACNTATAAAQEALEKRYPYIPVIGIEPAVRQAAKENPNGDILCLATAGTLASARYERQLGEVADAARVVSVAAPGIVTYVESGMSDRTAITAYLRDLLSPWKNIRFSGVVLGCTHFPFVASEIEEALGYSVSFYEPGRRVAEETRQRLLDAETANEETERGSVTIMNSASEKTMLSFSWGLFASALRTNR